MKRLLFTALSTLALLGTRMSPIAAGPEAATALPPVAQPDGRAGLCYSFYDPPSRPYLQMALDAGSRWDRFDFSWPAIEPNNNSWNFGPHDELVDALRDRGMNIIGILLWTPSWAATSGLQGVELPAFDGRPEGWYAPVAGGARTLTAPSAASSPPQGLYEEWNDWTTADGDGINYWGRYVYQVVSRYRGRVNHWEMWNEPEWNYFWTGTSAQYAQLLKVGYLATKAACPECTVLFGGLHYWANPNYYKWVLNTIKADPLAPANHYFFDVMSVHLYSRSDSTYDIVNEIRSGMTARVPDHPIWLTETGVPVWNDSSVDPDPSKYDYAATQAEAAAYVIQSYANARAAGVERYFFFRTHDADMGEYFGLIRNNRTLRPAYTAYQVAATYLVTPTFVTRVSYSNVRRVTFWGTPHGKVSVLWNTTPTSTAFSYPATLPTATLVDRWGVTQTITASGGSYALSLPGATANLVSNPNDYIIGGEPYLVIERDTMPPTSSLHTLPTTTFAYTITLSWDAGDDAAGVWGVDIQVKKDGGAWTAWRSFSQTAGLTSTVYEGAEAGAGYCFRIRAWDRAGNAEPWPVAAQSCTAIPQEREIHFQLRAVYGDENSNGLWDSGEITLTTPFTLRLVNVASADVITPAVGASWEFTATLPLGPYTLLVTPVDWWTWPPGWLPGRKAIRVELGEGNRQIVTDVGLFPHRVSLIFPLVYR